MENSPRKEVIKVGLNDICVTKIKKKQHNNHQTQRGFYVPLDMLVSHFGDKVNPKAKKRLIKLRSSFFPCDVTFFNDQRSLEVIMRPFGMEDRTTTCTPSVRMTQNRKVLLKVKFGL